MNIKVIIFAVVALIVGIGAGTGAVILTAPKHAVSDSLHASADSMNVLPVDAAHAALSRALEPAGDSTTAADPVETIMASAGGERQTGGAASGHRASSPPGTLTRGHAAAPAAGGSAASAKSAPSADTPHVIGAGLAESPASNMTGIFLNMKPVEAARILALLSDEQGSDILRSLEPRQAAGILCQLPPDRAAAVSRRMLLWRFTGSK